MLLQLVGVLDQESPSWRDNSVLVLDNVSYHRIQDVKNALARLRVPVIYLCPYSPELAAVEMVFAHVKAKELNQEKLHITKK